MIMYHTLMCVLSWVLLFVTPCSLPGSTVDGIIQAKILEWVAIPFSRVSSWLRDRTWVSCIAGRFFTIPATRIKAKNKNECIEILTKPQQL